jgi:hypothetical protein
MGQDPDARSDGLSWLLGLAVGLVGAMALFWLLTDVLAIGEGLAGLPAGAVLASSGPIGASVRRRSVRGLSTRDFLAIPHGVVSPAGYEIRVVQAVVIGVGAYVGAGFATGFFAGYFASAVLGFGEEASVAFAIGAGVAAYLVISLALGYWIGTRRTSHGLAVTIATIAIARLVDILIGVYVVPGLLEGTALELDGAPRLEDVLLNQASVLLTIAVLVASIIGWYRGRRQRAGSYLAFLARLLPSESRTALVDLAYQEATKDRERVPGPAEVA